MNILVDSGLKKKIQIENRKHRRGIYYLWLFEKIRQVEKPQGRYGGLEQPEVL